MSAALHAVSVSSVHGGRILLDLECLSLHIQQNSAHNEACQSLPHRFRLRLPEVDPPGAAALSHVQEEDLLGLALALWLPEAEPNVREPYASTVNCNLMKSSARV